MIRRVLSLLLIPLVLANQGLIFAHTHLGTSVAEPPGHTARPHVHLRGRNHHHGHGHKHSHGNGAGRHIHHRGGQHQTKRAIAVGLIPSCSHDDDALYVSETVIDRVGRLTASDAKSMQEQCHSSEWKLTTPEMLRLMAACEYCRPPPLSFIAEPLFLRTLSLRL